VKKAEVRNFASLKSSKKEIAGRGWVIRVGGEGPTHKKGEALFNGLGRENSEKSGAANQKSLPGGRLRGKGDYTAGLKQNLSKTW